MINKWAWLVVCLALVPVANATPSISGVTGSITHGGSTVISGADFGSKATAAPVLWDTIDNQEAYDALVEGDIIPAGDGYPWSANGSWECEDSTKYSILDPRIPGRPYYHAPSSSAGWLFGRDNGSTATEFYVSWWTRFSGNIYEGAGGSSSTKLIRIWPVFDNTKGFISWTGFHVHWSQYDGQQVQSTDCHWGDWDSGAEEYNAWHKCEIWVDSDGYETNTASFNCRTNGTIIHDIATLGGLEPFNCLLYLGFGANHPENLDDVTGDWTEIYVDTSFAHVIIGDASTYSAIEFSEAQIAQGWAADEIIIEVNQGMFADGEHAYIYITDSENAVNANGYEILFEGSMPIWQGGISE